MLIGKAGSNHYPQYRYHVEITDKENLQDRISQFSSHIAMQYMLDVIFGCIYNQNRLQNMEYLRASIGFMMTGILKENVYSTQKMSEMRRDYNNLGKKLVL
ncbi:MAG: hypothetical protein ACLT16_10545 [[Clostridium] innocuum]